MTASLYHLESNLFLQSKYSAFYNPAEFLPECRFADCPTHKFAVPIYLKSVSLSFYDSQSRCILPALSYGSVPPKLPTETPSPRSGSLLPALESLVHNHGSCSSRSWTARTQYLLLLIHFPETDMALILHITWTLPTVRWVQSIFPHLFHEQNTPSFRRAKSMHLISQPAPKSSLSAPFLLPSNQRKSHRPHTGAPPSVLLSPYGTHFLNQNAQVRVPFYSSMNQVQPAKVLFSLLLL